MNKQQELFKTSPQVNQEVTSGIGYKGEDYYLGYLEKNLNLWDMRAWLNYKDQTEVKAYVDETTHKNDGHSMWCVERLKELGVSKAKIIQTIMKNPHIQYKNRLGACMIKIGQCPRLKNAGGIYSDCACWKCEGKSNPLK